MFPAGLDYARDHFAPNLPERFIPARKSRTGATFVQSAIQPANRVCISMRHAAVFFLLPVVCPPTNLDCCCVTTNYTSTPLAKNHRNCKFRAIDRPEAVGTGLSSQFVAKVIGIYNEAIKERVFLDDTLGYKN